MGFLLDIFKKNIQKIFITNYNTTSSVNFEEVDVNYATGQYNAYVRCAVLNAIVNKISGIAVNSIPKIVNKDGKEITTGKGKELIDLLYKPNFTQNYTAFFYDIYRKLLIHDEVFILKVKNEGSNIVRSYVILENTKLDITMDYSSYPFATSNFFNRVRYTTPAGKVVDLTDKLDNIIVILNNEDNDFFSRGKSRLISLQDHINKYMISVNANKDILANYGAIGMWVNQGKDELGVMPIAQEEKDRINEALTSTYGITTGKRKHYITSQNLRHEKVSLPINELGLPETILDSTRAICDVFGYPIDLLSNEKGGSLQASGGREAEAKRQLISEVIEPLSYKISEKLSVGIEGELVFDYSHLDFMQESEKEKTELNQNNINIYSKLFEQQIINAIEYKNILTEKGILYEKNTI